VSVSPLVSHPMDVLSTLCLLAKIWGETVPILLIISNIKLDWKHIKGLVEYIELGNGWVLLKFTTVADREYVWVKHLWFVEGLNFVLSVWVPFFTPILEPIGIAIKIDHNTLLRKKGRFARVCLNINITKLLPGTLTIPTPKCQLSIPSAMRDCMKSVLFVGPVIISLSSVLLPLSPKNGSCGGKVSSL